MSDSILTDIRAGVMTITLNRPHVRNALDRDASVRLAAALDRLEADAGLHAAVLTGADGTFCAGTDLAALSHGESMKVGPRGFYGLVERPPLKPMIAAVEGFAVGGGFEVALSCDLIVAGATARFGLPEVRHGVLAGAGGVWRLASRIPYHRAMELALTGALIDADYARSLRLVTEVVAAGQALGRSQTLAAEIGAAADRRSVTLNRLRALRRRHIRPE